MKQRFAILGVMLAALPAGCRSAPEADLAALYDRSAGAHGPDRNPVVLLPGILGSNLRDAQSGKIVWGAFDGEYANPRRPEGARLVGIPMARDATLAELRDEVVQNGSLDRIRIRLLGLPVGVGAYVNILSALGVGGYRDEQLGLAGAVDYGEDHFTCFQFAYDWRRDLSELASELHAFLVEREAYVRAEHAKRGHEVDRVRFDVVAHSMGGLVLRYYLRYGTSPLPADGSLPELTWAGAELVERAIFIGTPNAGSVGAFENLRRGVSFGPFLPRYSAAILGTMPAIYQLLPRARHGWMVGVNDDPFDPALWQRMEWGLADPDLDDELAKLLPDHRVEERREIARDHQAKCLARAEQFHRALDVPSAPPPGTQLFLALGDASDTPAQVHVEEDGSVWLDYGPGDDTVLRTSALMDERLGGEWRPQLVSPISWSQVQIFFENHLGLTQDVAFTDNLLYLLLEDPRRGRL